MTSSLTGGSRPPHVDDTAPATAGAEPRGTDRPRVMEGTVVPRRAAVAGCASQDAGDRTVRAALADAGDIIKARVDDPASAPDARGLLAASYRGREGQAQVWFLANGRPQPLRDSVGLRGVAGELETAGWLVHRGHQALNIEATELVWRADRARRTTWDTYPAAHMFRPVGDATVHGWTFTLFHEGTRLFGWTDDDSTAPAPLWETREQAAAALTGRAPHGPRAGLRELAGLLAGFTADLSARTLAELADAHASTQDSTGGKTTASPYRPCARHLRQADQALTRAAHPDTGDEERDAATKEAGACIEAATTHAREAAGHPHPTGIPARHNN